MEGAGNELISCSLDLAVKRDGGRQFGGQFPRQTPIISLENFGTDARFPYELRQIVVVG
jgi:hypothetical protein